MNRNIHDLTTATAYDRDGEKLGSVKEVYINDSTGQPDFVEVGHGLFGMSSSIVPLRGHRLDSENLQLAFTKDRIQDAPNIRDDDHLSDEDHATIYRHFGLDGTPNETEYEPHRFDDDYDRDYDRRDYDRDRDLQRDAVEPTPAQGMPGDQVVAAGVTGAAAAPQGTDGTDGTDRTYGANDADDAGRASGDPAKLSVELMEAVTAELEDRGATVVEIPAGAANSTDSTESTGATGTAGAGDLSGISADAIIDIGFGKGSGEGFRVTGLYAGDDGTDSPATANLAAGIRDAFVFHGFWPANTFDGPGASAGTIVDGLSPAFGADGATGTPRVVVAPASTGHSDNMAELRGRDGRARFADSIADGIASMLRQR